MSRLERDDTVQQMQEYEEHEYKCHILMELLKELVPDYMCLPIATYLGIKG